MNSIIKKVCDDFKNNPKLTTADLGEKYDVYASTIAKYLKQGTKLGWCNYDSDIARRTCQRKLGIGINIYDKKNQITRQFESISQAERESYMTFGRRISHNTIRKYMDSGIEYDEFIITSVI